MGKPKHDLTGQTFGLLTVLDFHNGKWRCLCSCGTEKHVTGYDLRRGSYTSCGCGKRDGKRKLQDITGQTFGRLQVIEYAGNSKWRCLCSCGNYTLATGGHLRSGFVVSCGCALRERVPKIDLCGKQVGSLVVEKYVGNSKWECRCLACGTTCVALGYRIAQNKTTNCGCSRRKPKRDLTGQVFGRLTVVKYDTQSKWLCSCVCGNTHTVQSSSLLRGCTKSCGCLKSDCHNVQHIPHKETHPVTVGERFGLLIADTYLGKSYWECVCECGSRKKVRADHLRRKLINSCGCSRSDVYSNIEFVSRLPSQRMCDYPEYAIWRGIIVRCTDVSHEAYDNYGGRGITICDRWLQSFWNFYEDMGSRTSSEYTIDRRDNDAGYFKENCYYATRTEQARNRSTCKYVTIDGVTKTAIEWAEMSGLKPGTVYARLNNGWPAKEAVFSPLRTRYHKSTQCENS